MAVALGFAQGFNIRPEVVEGRGDLLMARSEVLVDRFS